MAKLADCMYCDPNSEKRHAAMIEVGNFGMSTLYVHRDQAHKGRVVVATQEHLEELFDLTVEERNQFMADVAAVTKAVKELWGCTKINMGSYGDKVPHLHFHICPKYEGDFEFGGTFLMNNPNPVHLSDEGYQEMIDALKERLGIA